MEILSADLGDLETAREAVALAISAYGRLDGLVINHGCLEPVTKVVESDIDEWKKGFDTNFFSAIAFVSASRLFWDWIDERSCIGRKLSIPAVSVTFANLFAYLGDI